MFRLKASKKKSTAVNSWQKLFAAQQRLWTVFSGYATATRANLPPFKAMFVFPLLASQIVFGRSLMLVDFPLRIDGESIFEGNSLYLHWADRTRQGLSVGIHESSQFFKIKYLTTVEKALSPIKEQNNRTQLHTWLLFVGPSLWTRKSCLDVKLSESKSIAVHQLFRGNADRPSGGWSLSVAFNVASLVCSLQWLWTSLRPPLCTSQPPL